MSKPKETDPIETDPKPTGTDPIDEEGKGKKEDIPPWAKQILIRLDKLTNQEPPTKPQIETIPAPPPAPEPEQDPANDPEPEPVKKRTILDFLF